MANETGSGDRPAETHPDRNQPKRDVLFYGDPHGEWRPLFEACAAEPPAAVVIVGDLGLTRPFREELEPVRELLLDPWWIPGNHDARTPEAHDWLWGDAPDWNLHCRETRLGGLAVAGLGGVFKQRVWYPRSGRAEPALPDRKAYLKQVSPAERWRGGLPLSARDTIFPEDARLMRRLRVDVLVTHEAPTTHRYGFAGIDAAAAACRAKLVVHGHHHQSYQGVLPGGVRVRGLGIAEVFRVRPEDLA